MSNCLEHRSLAFSSCHRIFNEEADGGVGTGSDV